MKALRTPRGGWPLTTQVAIAVLVTIGLSIWQMTRGLEKANLHDEYRARLNQPPLVEAAWRNPDSAYRRIALRGVMDPHRSFYVENQTLNGRPGYFIVNVLNTDRGRYLINRGWHGVTGDLHILPTIETPTHAVEITGILWPHEPISTTEYPTDARWPRRLRSFDVVLMARSTGAYAQEIRLTSESEGVLTPAPLVVERSVATHWSYAIQWLLIGGLVVGGYFYFTAKRQQTDE